MNKIALYIPRPGIAHSMVREGYVDALRHLGCKVYVGDPKTKLCCRKWIEQYGIKFIMTHSRYGMRQLPINIINENNIAVAINILPFNPNDITIDGPYEFAHDDEADLIKEIDSVITYTNLTMNTWSEYMCGWKNSGINIVYIPVAGNMMKALPPTCSTLTDVAMVANFEHRQDIMKKLIQPLFNRIDLLGYSHQVFGDKIWGLAGIANNGPLLGNMSKLAHVYATAKVCPNVHTARQVSLQACINERSFMIPLCGGIQVSDNPMAAEYLGPHCIIARSTTDFINSVIGVVEDQSKCFDKIRESVEHVAHNHTYFNRLTDIFNAIGLTSLGNEIKENGERSAVRYCWEMDARLSAEERGVCYEQQVIGTS